MMARIHVYGFDKNALRLMKPNLSNRCQITKINTSYRSWTELISVVPQGTVWARFPFIDNTDVCNYADDPLIHTCHMILNLHMDKLEGDAKMLIHWVSYHYMKMKRMIINGDIWFIGGRI